MKQVIMVAGGTGNLGSKIINALLAGGAQVNAIVRTTTSEEKLSKLKSHGVTVFKADMLNVEEVSKACVGVSCVVSALQGLHDVIVDTQKVLADAAVAAGVQRF